MGAIISAGQHAVIYGERGVGKTSLSNIIYDLLVMAGKAGFITAKFVCAQGITYGEIWRSIFKQLPVTRDTNTFHLDGDVPEKPNPEEIRELFQLLDNPTIVIIDELDRIDQETATLIADTIKTLSDRAIDTTLVLVGVGGSIDQLIEEHESILRCLVQIPMPRMSKSELLEIIDKGLQRAEMTAIPSVRERIANLSQGLPHYTHLLAKHCALEAIDNDRTEAAVADLEKAIKEAVENQSQTMASAYQKATHSPRKNLFREILLACALATEEEFFSAGDIREPLWRITGRRIEIPAFARHLKEFCGKSRGPILERKGQTRRFQYRFVNPLMEPFVVMKGFADGLLTEKQLSAPETSST